MPGVPPVSPESWKQVQQNIDVMQSGRRRKKRHKLSIAKLCSCVVAEQSDDLSEGGRPFEKKTPKDRGERGDILSIFVCLLSLDQGIKVYSSVGMLILKETGQLERLE
nr:ATPase family AAA domain-containing protein 2 [Biomphalaria glabrata]